MASLPKVVFSVLGAWLFVVVLLGVGWEIGRIQQDPHHLQTQLHAFGRSGGLPNMTTSQAEVRLKELREEMKDLEVMLGRQSHAPHITAPAEGLSKPPSHSSKALELTSEDKTHPPPEASQRARPVPPLQKPVQPVQSVQPMAPPPKPKPQPVPLKLHVKEASERKTKGPQFPAAITQVSSTQVSSHKKIAHIS